MAGSFGRIGVMGEEAMPKFGPGWVRPSFCEILRFTCGVCSFGFGLAECLFLLLLLLNIMLQPGTEHLCISRKCTALKWIFKAPLSQKVFRQTLHWTLFFPVAGLTKVVPRSSWKAAYCRVGSIRSGRLPII